jgi:hypothetical protein
MPTFTLAIYKSPVSDRPRAKLLRSTVIEAESVAAIQLEDVFTAMRAARDAELKRAAAWHRKHASIAFTLTAMVVGDPAGSLVNAASKATLYVNQRSPALPCDNPNVRWS